MTIVINVEDISKKYTIRLQKKERYTALRDVIASQFVNLYKHIRHPYTFQGSTHSTHDDFWALKDINFEIKHGERVGIIGRNGAGKSTLLKLLSRITSPTSGRIILKGRVASLLEVGTGFHPELTGRENIFLNGAILGMGKSEILCKLDEIIAFAEIEKFLDTPVKRYSSGMYLRLAFAVAAHLEPEILLIDEVLAVGDLGFQNKCLGKMEDVSKEGRTILFVSHNLALIKSLCNRTLLFDESRLLLDSSTDESINRYLNINKCNPSLITWNNEKSVSSEFVVFHKAYIQNCEGEIVSVVNNNADFFIIIEYEIIIPAKLLRIGFGLQNNEGVLMCGSNDPTAWQFEYRDIGTYRSCCKFPKNILSEGYYFVSFGADKFPYDIPLIRTDSCISFKILDISRHGYNKEILPGVIKPELQWSIKKQ